MQNNVQNKPNKRCYRDVPNQMYILVLILPNTTNNISTNINFEQIMVNFSTSTNFEQIMVDFIINWLCMVFHQTNFRFSFIKEIGINFGPLIGPLTPKTDKGYWTVEGSTVWYGSKAKKIKSKILPKILSNSTRPTEV